MTPRRAKRLPVVRDGVLVGMVTRANLLHALVSLATQPKAVGDDAAIRAQILAECDRQSWAPMSNVVVRNGVVELWGVITDERERQARIVAAENVPGVKAVHDHLVWVEPLSGFVVESPQDQARQGGSIYPPPAPEQKAGPAAERPETLVMLG